MGLQQYSTTAADNDDAGTGVNWAEGQDPSTVNNSARGNMKDLADYRNLLGGAIASGGSSNAYTLASALNPALAASTNGFLIAFEANHTNTGAVTLNVDSIGAVAVVRNGGAALAGGEIVTGSIYHVVYETGGSNYKLLNPSNWGSNGINAQTGTTYTFVIADANKLVTMDNASANAATIPPNSSVAYPIGTLIAVRQKGAGATTVTGGAGVTLNAVSTGAGLLTAKFASVVLAQEAADTWSISGKHGAVA